MGREWGDAGEGEKEHSNKENFNIQRNLYPLNLQW